MAYFSNGDQGSCFEAQCAECRYGKGYCPIHAIQSECNYEAVGNKVATKILNHLVKPCGICAMFETFEKDFKLTEGEKSQLELF